MAQVGSENSLVKALYGRAKILNYMEIGKFSSPIYLSVKHLLIRIPFMKSQ